MHNHFLKAGLLAAVLVLLFLIFWEGHFRSRGIPVSYDDGPPLWSNQRKRVYLPSDKATVFIGSSRIKYDLDIPTWKALTGQEAVQLAIEGTSPRPVLEELAADKNFRGRLIIDVTEGLFFSSSPNNTSEPLKNIKYFKEETPAQKASFVLNHALESGLVFLDRESLSLNAFLYHLAIKDRPGVFRFPEFPLEFGRVSFERQNRMMDKFLVDTQLQNMVKGNWLFFASVSKEKPPAGPKLDSILLSIKTSVDQIRARGGQVLFVRTPSSGGFWMAEQKGFPRKEYWDRLLAVTGTPGIHFEDDPETDHFECPELSHLSPADAVTYTRAFVRILKNEKGWAFPANH